MDAFIAWTTMLLAALATASSSIPTNLLLTSAGALGATPFDFNAGAAPVLPPPLLLLAATPGEISLLTTIAAGFAAAWALGLVTQSLGLSPIVGYLAAGIVIGPYTPGFTGDVGLAQQLAEIGVILLMFGVGMHFHLKDLWAVRKVAIPGAIGQSLTATLGATLLFVLLGWSVANGAILGMAMAVASTVVLLRVLIDRGMLATSHGHVAVGWLIVEDIFTVLLLVMLPIFAVNVANADATAAAVVAGSLNDSTAIAPGAISPPTADASGDAGGPGGGALTYLITIGWAVLKLVAMVAVVLVGGRLIVPAVLTQVAKLRSAELFTLTVLVLSVAIAVGSAVIFGASVALGAFLAGIVVAQTPVSHQAAADALPMRDAFAVLFFVSVGMLFDPSFLVEQPLMVMGGVAVVMLLKPLAALIIVALTGYPLRTGITVALGLAQIGEFSFILGQVATNYGLLPPEGMNVLVASAMISITLNPMLFRSLDRIEHLVENRLPRFARLLNARHTLRTRAINRAAGEEIATARAESRPLAVIVGYGPVGRLVDRLLRDAGMHTVIIEMNINTVRAIASEGRTAIYGDATRRQVLEKAGIAHARSLVVTLPHTEGRAPLVTTARELNPVVDITVRARYLAEREILLKAGATRVVVEEGEAGMTLARQVMEQQQMSDDAVTACLANARGMWGLAESAPLRSGLRPDAAVAPPPSSAIGPSPSAAPAPQQQQQQQQQQQPNGPHHD